MANFTTVPTRSAGDAVASADWNTYVRDNFASLAGLICYYNGASAPSGTTEFTTARGLFICALVSSGTLATAVGTPLTNQQNVSHTHTSAITGFSQSGATSGSAGNVLVANSASSLPAVVSPATSGAGALTGGTSAGSIGIPYLQLLCVQHV